MQPFLNDKSKYHSESETRTWLGKSTVGRENFLHISNMTDTDYTELEQWCQEQLMTPCPDTEISKSIHKPNNKDGLVAAPGDDILLFMLGGGGAEFQSLLFLFDNAARERHPTVFAHMGKQAVVKSDHPGEEDKDIIMLSDKDRDKLLYTTRLREAARFKNAWDHDQKSLGNVKRRAVGHIDASPSKPYGIRHKSESTPRLYNLKLTIIGISTCAGVPITEREFDHGDVKTGQRIDIPFHKFCSLQGYNDVTNSIKPGLDVRHFSAQSSLRSSMPKRCSASRQVSYLWQRR